MKAWLVYRKNRPFEEDKVYQDIQSEVSLCLTERAKDKEIERLESWLWDSGGDMEYTRVVEVEIVNVQGLRMRESELYKLTDQKDI